MKAPVMSATPKNSSAAYDNNKQKTKENITKRLKSVLWVFISLFISLKATIPTIIANIKNNNILPITIQIFVDVSEEAQLEIIVRAMIPKISSIIAAPKIALPAFEFNLPSSLKVSTVILTEVAVNITPINICCKNKLESKELLVLKKLARINPKMRGTIIPKIAITTEATPLFFNSLISVSNPAVNIKTITPSSASCCIKSVSCNIFKTAGPRTRPAKRAPTTWGSLNRLVTSPNALVLSKITAISNKNL